MYIPYKNETSYKEKGFPLQLPEKKFFVPNGKDSNPLEIAAMLYEKLKNNKVFLLISGSMFDRFGTRYGKGGGWYDRFLSKIPRQWIRIGIANESNFYEERLKRKNWDEPMDFIIVKKGLNWEIIKIT